MRKLYAHCSEPSLETVREATFSHFIGKNVVRTPLI
jgi:hypothetical protein